MKIASINLSNSGSTGKIMKSIAKQAERNGNIVLNMFPMQAVVNAIDKTDYIIKSNFSLKTGVLIERIFGLNDCLSICSTFKLINKLKDYSPDLIHLHNIHGSYLNLRLLFNYLCKSGVHVVWTLHDCWSFTGRCPYFDIVNCDKWKTECCKCPYPPSEYPGTFRDRSKWMHTKKKDLFTQLEYLTIVTPSRWLADLTSQSFLAKYPIRVINNGIDLAIYRSSSGAFRKRYFGNFSGYLILGVAFSWGYRKGLDVFIKLANDLPADYRIVLVGTSYEVDEQLPKNIISIHRTQNQAELAEIYTAADVFVNPTREDNFPTVNLEALACGTPVITFNTGGSPECIDENCGVVVDRNDVDALEREIIRVCSEKPFSKEACIRRSQAFDNEERFKEYVGLYKEITDSIRDNTEG